MINASGGLERDKAGSYPQDINCSAQALLVDACLPLFPRAGRVVFVTSHMAHFYGQGHSVPEYEPVAASKHAGEIALRERISSLSEPGLTLVVVSGDIIEGTITPRLLERQHPGLMEARRRQSGTLPSIEEFAQAIVAAASDPRPSTGATRFVGSVDDFIRADGG